MKNKTASPIPCDQETEQKAKKRPSHSEFPRGPSTGLPGENSEHCATLTQSAGVSTLVVPNTRPDIDARANKLNTLTGEVHCVGRTSPG